jgi:hypothetical protein
MIPGWSGSYGLFNAFQALDTLVLAIRQKDSAVSIDTFALAAQHALDSLGSVLSALLSLATAPRETSNIFQTLSIILTNFLLAVPPLLCTPRKKQGSTEMLDALIDRLLTSVLRPLTSSFHRLSLAHLSAILCAGTTSTTDSRSKKLHYDIRPAALGLLRCALDAMRELAVTFHGNAFLIASVQSVHEAVTLSAARELEKLYPLPEPVECEVAAETAPNDVGESQCLGPALPQPSPPQIPGQMRGPTNEGRPTIRQNAEQALCGKAPLQRADHIAKLARKDALWYICSVLHCAIPGTTLAPTITGAHPPPETYSDTTAPNEMLRGGVYTVLAGLLRRTAPPADFHVQGLQRGDEPECDSSARCGEEGRPLGCSSAIRSRIEMLHSRALGGNVERGMLLAVAEKLWLAQG